MVDDPSCLPVASIVKTVTSSSDGYVKQVAAELIGQAAFDLGAGREKKGDPIDLAVGLKVHIKVGDRVEKGMPLVTVHANHEAKLAASNARIEQAIALSDHPVGPLPLFYGTIYGR
jgi:pyrimidine-nucleoside phosphorylase